MRYRKFQERHFTRFILTGRLTGQGGDEVRDLIADVKRVADRRCVLDLGGLEFIDSAGIGMLLVVNGEAVAAGKAVAMLVGEGQVLRVVTLTRIGMIIPQFESVDAYVAACVPEEVLAEHPCAPGEDPLALAARALTASAA
ncbi:STAS domain-containing protein [Azospirillum sp. TSO22-1]|uniref:STAS domain-containing protein n=1 Tax=Azospirillum sp. TSO22-1 TaxID=716789 RepID=UPI0013047DAE|nr:STAS domain-containing protein [Azospirillum sp. TSO22-1]